MLIENKQRLKIGISSKKLHWLRPMQFFLIIWRLSGDYLAIIWRLFGGRGWRQRIAISPALFKLSVIF